MCTPHCPLPLLVASQYGKKSSEVGELTVILVTQVLVSGLSVVPSFAKFLSPSTFERFPSVFCPLRKKAMTWYVLSYHIFCRVYIIIEKLPNIIL